jgi:DNA sulfur modification protein DndD
MLIKSLHVKNFTSYRDEQSIEFATGEKNVTIIEGEMGHGKSNLLNAFYWCFFNKYWNSDLAKFIDDPDPIKYHLINKGELESNTEEIEVCVKVEFEIDDGSFYTAERKLVAYFINSKWECDNKTIFNVGVKSAETGQYQLFEDDLATGAIQTYFSIELSNYFLFRGENRDELTKLTGKSLFVDAIKKLSKLKMFERLADHLELAQKKAQKEVGRQVGGDVEKKIDLLQTKIAQEDVLVEAYSERKDILADELKEAEVKYEKNRKLINMNAAAAKLQSQVGILEHEIDQWNNQIESLKNERNIKIVTDWASMLVLDTLTEVLKNYNDGVDNELYPPDIKKSLVEKILLDEECICGCDLKNDEAAKKRINLLISNAIEDDQVRLVQKLAGKIEDNIPKIKLVMGELQGYNQQITLITQKINKNNTTIQGIKPRIGNISVDIGELQKNQDDAKQVQEFTNRKISDMIRSIEKAKSEKIGYQQEIDALQDQLNQSDKPVLRAELARKAQVAAALLHNEYEQIIFKDIEKYMQQNWETICYDILNYEKVKLDHENKFFDVCDKHDNSRRSSMNTGHRLLLTISFISSLMRLAREMWGETYPIVMDAPLSEVGTSAMPKAVVGLTEIFNQTIMILQDGSITPEIKQDIGHVLGKRYQISFNKNEEHSTVTEIGV